VRVRAYEKRNSGNPHKKDPGYEVGGNQPLYALKLCAYGYAECECMAGLSR
jgi:hypothetical protein